MEVGGIEDLLELMLFCCMVAGFNRCRREQHKKRVALLVDYCSEKDAKTMLKVGRLQREQCKECAVEGG